MGKYIEYVLRIASYFVLVYFIYGQIKIDYKKYISGVNYRKLSFGKITIISAIVSAWAIFNLNLKLDQLLYGYQFLLEEYNPAYQHSYGLGLVYDFLHFFTYNPYIMFVFVIFWGTFLTLSAYRIDKNIKPEALMILFLSEYFLYSFAAIKQFIASGFSFLFFAYLANGKKRKCLIWVVFAIMFHEMAYILIPVYLFFHFKKSKFIKFSAVTMFAVVFLMPSVFNEVLSALFKIVPDLERQLSMYMSDGMLVIQKNYATVLKGLPYYIACGIPIWLSDTAKKKVPHYETGFSLTVMCAILVLSSFYNYWYFRFSYLFMLPVFSWVVNMADNSESSNVRLLKNGMIYVFLGLTLKYMFQMYFKYGGL